MVFGSMMSGLVMQGMDFMRFCRGFSAKNTQVDQFNWSYIEREGKDEENTDVVVFLHGFSSIKESWVRVAGGVDKRFKIIIPDLPGQGRTTPVDAFTNYSMDRQARRLHEFLQSEVAADKKLHLVGCSMGGMLAGMYSAMYPQRVESLTMICPAGLSMSKKSDALVLLEETGKNLLLAHTVDDILEMNGYISHTPTNFPRWLCSVLAKEREKQLPILEKIVADSLAQPTVLEEQLRNIRANTLVMWGREDRILDVSCLETLEKNLLVQKKHIMVFDACGHILQHEKHEECTQAINEFLAGKVPTKAFSW